MAERHGVAFSGLLEWLDDGTESRGERYLEIRRRLVSYFDRRNHPSPDGLADETFRRIGATLKRDGAIATRPPARYCYAVAKRVLLEETQCLARSYSHQEPPGLPLHTVRR